MDSHPGRRPEDPAGANPPPPTEGTQPPPPETTRAQDVPDSQQEPERSQGGSVQHLDQPRHGAGQHDPGHDAGRPQDRPRQSHNDPGQPQHQPEGSRPYPQQPGSTGGQPEPGAFAPSPQQPGPYGAPLQPGACSQQPGSYGLPPGGPSQSGAHPQQAGPDAGGGNSLAYPGPPHAQQYPATPYGQQYPGSPYGQGQQGAGMPYGQQFQGGPQGQQYPGLPYGQPQAGPGQHPGMYPGQPMPPWVQPREPRVFPVPAEAPYHRLARNAKHIWWRPIVGTLVLALAAVVLTIAVVIPWMIVHTILAGDLFDTSSTSDDLFANVNEEIAISLVSIGILTPAVLFAARFIQRRPAWSIASVVGRIRWRWLLLCCLPALAYVAISYLLGIVVELIFPTADTPADEGSWVGFGAFVVPALIIVCLVPFQSAAEEFVFRGWVIQAIGAYGPDRVEGKAQWLKRAFRTPWPGIVITSVLFVSAHGYTDWAMADIFMFAMLVGWLTVYTGGLEAAIALHVLNNLAAFGVSAATGQLEGWDVQGSAPWTTLLVDIPAFAAFGVLVVWLARRKQIARVSPAAVQR